MTNNISAPTTYEAEAIRSYYGVQESNGLTDGNAYHRGIPAETVTLAQVAEFGARISRVRILTSENLGGYRLADISYIHAERDGIVRRVQVDMPNCVHLYGRGRDSVKGAMIEWATREGVSAKALGLLDEGNWSVLLG